VSAPRSTNAVVDQSRFKIILLEGLQDFHVDVSLTDGIPGDGVAGNSLIDLNFISQRADSFTLLDVEEACAHRHMAMPFSNDDSDVTSLHVVAELQINFILVPCRRGSEGGATINVVPRAAVGTVLE